MIGFYNQDEKCLLRGTDWVFKLSGLRLIFKGLNNPRKEKMACKFLNNFQNDPRDSSFTTEPFCFYHITLCSQLKNHLICLIRRYLSPATDTGFETSASNTGADGD